MPLWAVWKFSGHITLNQDLQLQRRGRQTGDHFSLPDAGKLRRYKFQINRDIVTKSSIYIDGSNLINVKFRLRGRFICSGITFQEKVIMSTSADSI